MIPVLFLTALSASQARAAEGPRDVCDMPRVSAPAGELETLAGTALFTRSGAYLRTDQCPRPTPSLVLILPHEKFSSLHSAPPVAFEADADALTRLLPYFRPTGGQSQACTVITGQLFLVKRFRVRRGQGNGWGPNGMARAVLVIKSVDQIRPAPKTGSRCSG